LQVLFTIGEFFGFMGMYVPFYYITTYSISQNIVSSNLGFYLLTLLNAGSVFGRIVPNFFSDKIGPLNVTLPFSILCGIIAFSWTSIHSIGPLVVFCIFYGFFSGTFVSITGPALATLSPDLALVGTHMGMSFAFAALGLLIGNPVAGLLLDSAGWLGPAAFCGVANVLAGFFIAGARWWKVGWKVWAKV
jgi:MFS family permease